MKSKNKILLAFFILILSQIHCAYASDDNLLVPVYNYEDNIQTKPTINHFNLANIVDSFLSNDSTTTQADINDKVKTRKEFMAITSKFNQGNASVAYDEYMQLVESLDNDTSLLTLSKIFYEIGFFSLANKATDEIVYKNQFYDNILDLEKCYKPKVLLSKDDEIYFAKLYSSIYFDNSASEALGELSKKQKEYQKNDYAQFMFSRAYLELKQYQNALNSINKAISINPSNISYQNFKIDILIAMKKYSEAKKLINKLEKRKVTINFVNELDIKKETVLAVGSKTKERKYHIINKTFLEGNFEKTKKDCLSVLNFDKDNDDIIALYAKAELALGNLESANTNFVNAYQQNKSNKEAIVGLGDIRYLHGDYKNAVKMYKKAYKKNKKNGEILIKLATAQRQLAQNPKELKKLELLVDKMPKKSYVSYYTSAISIAQNNNVLKEDFLKRSLMINPMFENALGSLVEVYLKNKNYKTAKTLIYNASFTLRKNYYYYYLCGLYNQTLDKKQEAIQFYKTSLSLNPNFEIANTKLLKLIPDSQNEEI